MSRRSATPVSKRAPKVGFVSLGCPKALVDSERILTHLRAEGYEVAPTYDAADVVVVNTCGFIDAAVDESLDAIGEALEQNGRVIVTGCLGAKPERILERHPRVLKVTGPHAYEDVLNAVHDHLPPQHDPFFDLLPPQGIRLTPRHYAYLKISEGCNNKCSFCIIPDMRGKLVSRRIDDVLREGERLVKAGVKELLVISQDTSAYGADIRYASGTWREQSYETRFIDLARGLGSLGAWVRLHYVYPYPHVDEVIPLMAERKVLPYLDIPFQHGSPSVLKRMRRPAHAVNTLARIKSWREQCPDLVIRSTFIVGFPGETEAEFEELLAWLDEAQLDRVGCFKYSPVEGAGANALPDHVSPQVQEERHARFMERAAEISAKRLAARIGRRMRVLVDAVEKDVAVARSEADAPEIDGVVRIKRAKGIKVGDWADVEITSADAYDLHARALLADAVDLEAYFQRIGYTGPRTDAASLETLAAIHRLHPSAIAFETLDALLKRRIILTAAALEQKLLHSGRGGWCFEQNLLLSRVLQSLGFGITGLAARVLWNRPEGEVRARTHMLLLVEGSAGGPYIADVGFGGLTLTGPLRLVPDVEQATPHEVFRLCHARDGRYILQVLIGDAWKPMYSFDLQPQVLPDYEVWNWHLCHHPESPFINNLMVARVTPERRYGLFNNRLSIHHLRGASEQTVLTTAAELRAALEGPCKIRLPDDPALDVQLQRLVSTGT